MANTLFLLIVTSLVVLLWLDAARAREFATLLVRRYCDNRGMQFLDDTVSLARMGIRWTSSGLRIRRMFRFDFSLEGTGRRTGYILMLGTRLETIDDGLPRDDEAPAPDEPPQNEDRKVVPFRRKNDPR